MTAAPAGAAVTAISTNPALYPAFSPGVSDYVVRCTQTTPVERHRHRNDRDDRPGRRQGPVGRRRAGTAPVRAELHDRGHVVRRHAELLRALSSGRLPDVDEPARRIAAGGVLRRRAQPRLRRDPLGDRLRHQRRADVVDGAGREPPARREARAERREHRRAVGRHAGNERQRRSRGGGAQPRRPIGAHDPHRQPGRWPDLQLEPARGPAPRQRQLPADRRLLAKRCEPRLDRRCRQRDDPRRRRAGGDAGRCRGVDVGRLRPRGHRRSRSAVAQHRDRRYRRARRVPHQLRDEGQRRQRPRVAAVHGRGVPHRQSRPVRRIPAGSSGSSAASPRRRTAGSSSPSPIPAAPAPASAGSTTRVSSTPATPSCT